MTPKECEAQIRILENTVDTLKYLANYPLTNEERLRLIPPCAVDGRHDWAPRHPSESPAMRLARVPIDLLCAGTLLDPLKVNLD